MAPLHNSNSSQMHANSDESDHNGIVEVDRKWKSPPSSKKASTRSPTMPRRSDPTLGVDVVEDFLEMSPSDPDNSKSRSLSPSSASNKKSNKINSLADLNMSVTSFTAFVEEGLSPPPSMPHRRASTHEGDGAPVISDGELGGRTWQSNHTTGGQHEELFMTLNDGDGEKKKIRRVRRNGGIQRAFSDSELSEASTIASQKESKKDRKKSLRRRKERLAEKFLGRGKVNVPETLNDEDEDVVDTDKDLEGFTGITLKKSAHSTDNESHHNNTSGTDEMGSVATKKTQNEIDVETRSRVSKSPIRFPTRDRSHSRGRARSSSRRGRASGSSVAAKTDGATEPTAKKKKKKSASLSRSRRRAKKASDEDSSSDEEYEKPPRAGSKSRGSKSPARRNKKPAGRKPKKGGRKPIPAPQFPLNDDGSTSQRTMTDLVVSVPPTQEFVSPCTIGSGRRSVMDTLLTPSNRSRNSRVSAITMSTGMFSPFTAVSSVGFNDDFSKHSDYTDSSLRGPQHIPDLEASERQASSLLATGHLSAVFENSSRTDGLPVAAQRPDGLGQSAGTEGLGQSARTEPPTTPSGDMGGTPRSTRSSLRMPAVPRRRPSSDDHSLTSPNSKGPLFDNSSNTEENEEVPFDRFAPMVKVRSSSDLMGRVDERPTNMLKKASSERNVLASTFRMGAERVWRRGKKKPQLKEES